MKAIRALTVALSVAAVAAALPGCGSPLSEVSGTVQVDGKALPEGEIIFEAADGKTTPAAGPIKDGKYTVQVLPGAKKVKINASRPTAKPDPVMGTSARESMIPAEFNDQTKLTADVKTGKQDNVNFEVKSIRRKK
jgi:hypothetical protein